MENHLPIENKNLNSNNNKISNELIIKSTLNFEDLKNECFKTNFKKGFIYIFTNMGLVASGKSTVSSMLETQIINKAGESSVNFSTVSSDKLRMKIEKTMGVEKKQLAEDKFNERVMKKTKKAFDDELFAQLEKWEQDKFNFILLDKNFFVNTLSDLKKYFFLILFIYLFNKIFKVYFLLMVFYFV